jgi:tRNA(adenine34) deaminase
MHEIFMKEALKLAEKAYTIGEVPVGCVIVDENDKIIGSGYNMRNIKKNSLYHAEIFAINEACNAIEDWRLENCTLYVTVEPCPMCAGAIIQARITNVVFGTRNRKAGCAGSILNILSENRFNHQTSITEGILAEQCAALMTNFFANFRNKQSINI